MIDTPRILDYLDCPPQAPSIRALNRLIRAAIRKLPWESVFRIGKRASTPDLAQCPRWPEEFWQDALHRGGGGTCFEINYAFFSLLRSLGYSSYLTVNDMGDQRGCHAAIVTHLRGQNYLVDVGIPLLVALPIHPGRPTCRFTWLHTYTVQPEGPNRYQVLRTRHPKPNIYTLLDTPWNEASYRAVVERDYGDAGLFLDRVIVVKVIGDCLWRFSSSDLPYRLEWFAKEEHGSIPIPDGQAARIIAERFQMDEGRIEMAFKAIQR